MHCKERDLILPLTARADVDDDGDDDEGGR